MDKEEKLELLTRWVFDEDITIEDLEEALAQANANAAYESSRSE